MLKYEQVLHYFLFVYILMFPAFLPLPALFILLIIILFSSTFIVNTHFSYLCDLEIIFLNHETNFFSFVFFQQFSCYFAFFNSLLVFSFFSFSSRLLLIFFLHYCGLCCLLYYDLKIVNLFFFLSGFVYLFTSSFLFSLLFNIFILNSFSFSRLSRFQFLLVPILLFILYDVFSLRINMLLIYTNRKRLQ